MELDVGLNFPLIIGDIVIILKGFYLLGLFMYVIFAVGVIKQVDMMSKSLSGILFLPVRTIAWLHLVATLVVFVSAVLLL